MYLFSRFFRDQNREPKLKVCLVLEKFELRDLPSSAPLELCDVYPILAQPQGDSHPPSFYSSLENGDEKKEEPKKDEQKHETKGMGGRKLTDAEKKEFDDFGDLAKKVGLVENPNRTGEWGKMVNGKFQRVTRIDVGDPTKNGWEKVTHIHIYDDKGEGGKEHLDPKTPIPGESK